MLQVLFCLVFLVVARCRGKWRRRGGNKGGGSTGEKYDILGEFFVVYFIWITIYRGCRVGELFIIRDGGGLWNFWSVIECCLNVHVDARRGAFIMKTGFCLLAYPQGWGVALFHVADSMGPQFCLRFFSFFCVWFCISELCSLDCWLLLSSCRVCRP